VALNPSLLKEAEERANKGLYESMILDTYKKKKAPIEYTTVAPRKKEGTDEKLSLSSSD